MNNDSDKYLFKELPLGFFALLDEDTLFYKTILFSCGGGVFNCIKCCHTGYNQPYFIYGDTIVERK